MLTISSDNTYNVVIARVIINDNITSSDCPTGRRARRPAPPAPMICYDIITYKLVNILYDIL